MPPVFGRNSVDHPWDSGLVELQKASDPGSRALAWNLRNDDRVSPAREKALLELTPEDLRERPLDALTHYFEQRIRASSDPDFRSPDLNGENLCEGAHAACFDLPGECFLGTILDLNGLADKLYRWAKETNKAVRFASFGDDVQEQVKHASMPWIDRQITQMGKWGFVDEVLRLLRLYRREGSPYQPTWAVLWDDLEPVLKAEPHRWLECLGMAKPEGRWVIVLRYSFEEVQDVGPLVRPTVLDAGKHPEHFPSPPDGLPRGGHPMDLCMPPPEKPLLREFIHCQIDHTLDQWEVAGSLCEKTKQATKRPDLLGVQRSAHLARLKHRHSHCMVSWPAAP